MAIVGHFPVQHGWERFKPTDTMWLYCEIWDAQARAQRLHKGQAVQVAGHMIQSKWIDKTTGEDRKTLKLRSVPVIAVIFSCTTHGAVQMDMVIMAISI